jgi:hypothetical protein
VLHCKTLETTDYGKQDERNTFEPITRTSWCRILDPTSTPSGAIDHIQVKVREVLKTSSSELSTDLNTSVPIFPSARLT